MALRKQAGLTLLETLLVIALIVLGVVLGIQQYQKNNFNRHVAQIQNSVKLLSTALKQYYLVNCVPFLGNGYTAYTIALNSNASFLVASSTNPTFVNYITEPTLIDNAYNTQQRGLNAYTYVIDVTGDFPIIRISTTMNVSPIVQNILAGRLKPTSRNGNQFTWSENANNTAVPHLSSNLSYMQWLSMNFTNPNTPGFSGQYTYNAQAAANICVYWQQPQYRCKLTSDGNHCKYQNAP